MHSSPHKLGFIGVKNNCDGVNDLGMRFASCIGTRYVKAIQIDFIYSNSIEVIQTGILMFKYFFALLTLLWKNNINPFSGRIILPYIISYIRPP